jgi:hypothetical protein
LRQRYGGGRDVRCGILFFSANQIGLKENVLVPKFCLDERERADN